MKKIVVITLVIAAMCTVGCKKVQPEPPQLEGLAMTFTGNIEASALSEESTRAMASKDGFVKGDSIGVFVVPWKNATTAGTLLGQGNYADNVPFIAGVDPTKFAPSAKDKITFPNATTKVNVYAFAMYHKRYNDLGTTPTSAAWKVEADQSTAKAVIKNDLITANNTGVNGAGIAPTVSAVPLHFVHRLSKVEVLFTAPTTYKGEAVNLVKAVYVVNSKIDATVNLTDTTSVPVLVAGKDTASISAFKAEAKASTSPVGATDYQYEAIVLPQAIAANSIVARVVLEVGAAKKLVTFDCISAVALTYTVKEKVQLKLTFEGENVLTISGVTIAAWGKTTDAAAVAKRPSQVLIIAVGNKTTAATATSARLTVDNIAYEASVTMKGDTMRCSYLSRSEHFGNFLTSVQFKNASGSNVGNSFSGNWTIPGRPNDYEYKDVTTTLTF